MSETIHIKPPDGSDKEMPKGRDGARCREVDQSADAAVVAKIVG